MEVEWACQLACGECKIANMNGCHRVGAVVWGGTSCIVVLREVVYQRCMLGVYIQVERKPPALTNQLFNNCRWASGLWGQVCIFGALPSMPIQCCKLWMLPTVQPCEMSRARVTDVVCHGDCAVVMVQHVAAGFCPPKLLPPITV